MSRAFYSYLLSYRRFHCSLLCLPGILVCWLALTTTNWLTTSWFVCRLLSAACGVVPSVAAAVVAAACLHAAGASSAAGIASVLCTLCFLAGDLNLRSLAQSAHNKRCTLKLVLFQDKVAVEQESNAPSTTPCLLQSGALRASLADMTGALKPMRDQIMLDARHTRAYKCGRTLSSLT